MGQMDLLRHDGIKAVSPMLEFGAYEAVWARPEATFHRLANRFRDGPGALPSDFVDHGKAMAMAKTVVTILREASVDRLDLRVHGTLEYPERLRDAKKPVEVDFSPTNSPSTQKTGQVSTRPPGYVDPNKQATLQRRHES